MFSNLFSITLPNIGKYFPGIHFSWNSLSPEFTFQKETTFQQTNGALASSSRKSSTQQPIINLICNIKNNIKYHEFLAENPSSRKLNY